MTETQPNLSAALSRRKLHRVDICGFYGTTTHVIVILCGLYVGTIAAKALWYDLKSISR